MEENQRLFFKFFLVYAVCTLLFLRKGNTFEALVTHGERQWKQATVNHPFVTVLCKKKFPYCFLDSLGPFWPFRKFHFSCASRASGNWHEGEDSGDVGKKCTAA